MMQAVEKALSVLEWTRERGCISVGLLSHVAGWNASQASRYLAFLSAGGWLERVNGKGHHPKYVLGPKVLQLSPDLSFSGPAKNVAPGANIFRSGAE